MTRLLRIFLSFMVLISMTFLTPALAEKRVALVIGNGAYAKAGTLTNPIRDAEAVATMLKSAGFDIVAKFTDLPAKEMRRALRNFSDHARNADIALVFYAGHGLEVNGVNYLIPIDAVLERDIDVEDEAVQLDRVNQVLDQTKRLRLIVLDACRDNPFVRSMKRTLTGRSIGRGLAKVDILTSDTLIAYAAKAGSTAADGDGNNSPYTTAFLKHLSEPGLDVRLAFGRVRDEVLHLTSNRQEPFLYGSLGGDQIPLVPAIKKEAASELPKAPNSGSTTPEREWNQFVRNSRDLAVIEAFKIKHRDDPLYAALADSLLAKLRRENEAANRQLMEAEEQRRKEEEERRMAEEAAIERKKEHEARQSEDAKRKAEEQGRHAAEEAKKRADQVARQKQVGQQPQLPVKPKPPETSNDSAKNAGARKVNSSECQRLIRQKYTYIYAATEWQAKISECIASNGKSF